MLPSLCSCCIVYLQLFCFFTHPSTNNTFSGYMPPEYVVHGRYSMKSDVFSFGVIVLEIISGNKITGFYDPEHSLNLVGHVSTSNLNFTSLNYVKSEYISK